MVRRLSALAGASLLLAPGLLALDLSPVPGFRTLEGFEIPVVTMRDGERTVRWQPPAEWKLGGSPAKLVLTSPQFAGATIELQVLRREPGGRDGFVKPEQREAWLRGFLPKDARDVTVVAEHSNPFTLREQDTHEVIFEYVSQARRLTSSISVTDLNERERFVLNVTAAKPDFRAVHGAAMSSMFSWDWAE